MNAGRPRFAPVVVAVGLAAVAAWLGLGLELDHDIARLLPDRSPAAAQASRAVAELLNRTLVDVAAVDDEVTLEELGAAADRIADAMRGSGFVRRAQSRLDADAILPAAEILRQRAPLLLSPAQLQGIAPRLEPDTVMATITDLAWRIRQIDGAHLKARAPVDPLGITDLALAPLAQLGDSFGATRLVDGRITSADGRHVLVVLEPNHAPDDADRATRFLDVLEAALADATAGHPGMATRYAGAHRATLDNVRQIQSDVRFTSITGAIGVALLAVLCLGRFWLALLALTPGVFGGVCAWGLFALFHDSTSGAVLGFGAVLLGLTVDFAIHVLFRIEHEDGTTLRLPLRALVMGGTTTSLAFLALRASSLPALRDVGVFGALGIVGAVSFAIFVLPTLHRPRPGARRRRPRLDLSALVRAYRRPARTAMVVAAIATPIFGLGCWFLRFEGDPTKLSALSAAARRDEQQVQAVFGPPGQASALLIEAPTLEEVLQRNDRLAAWLDARAENGALQRHGSIAGLLPSRASQTARLAAWRTFFDADRQARLRQSLDRATNETLFRDGTFQPFLEFVAATPPWLTRDTFGTEGLGALIDERLRPTGGGWRVTTPVFTADWEQTAALQRQLATALPEVTFLNRQSLARELAAMVTGEVGWLGLIAFALVAAVVFLWHGQVLITVAVLLPLLLSLLWTLGLLGWFGIPISLANAIFVVLLFGIAVDYAIFLTTSRLERFHTGVDRVTESQASVLLCTLTTCFGFGSLALAGHPVLHTIGLTSLIGIFAAATTTQIFVPALTDALLVRRGPNGTPGVRNVYYGLWAFRMMMTRGVLHLLRHGRGADTPARQAAAIDRIHDMGVRLRTRIPGSRAVYVDADKLLDRPCVLVSNHESMFDIMAVLALPKRTQLLVKGWVWRMPVMGAMVRAAGYILAQESDPDEVFRLTRARVEAGNSLLIFPEGKRSRDGRVGRFHNGAFAIARGLDLPVQPIAMIGTRQTVPPGAWWIGHHDAHICVLDPLDPKDFHGEGADRRMARAARDAIRRCREDRAHLAWNGPRWPLRIGSMYRYLGPMVSHYATSKCKRDPLIAALPDLLRGDDPVLVAGCGMGLMANRLAVAFPERPICGIDTDDRKLQTARAAIGDFAQTEYRHADLRTDPLPNVGTALLVDVLHYWDRATQELLLRRLFDCLTPGGTLLVRDGCGDQGRGHGWVAWCERMALRSGFTQARGPLLFHDAKGWEALLIAAGFTVAGIRDDLGLGSNRVWICRRPPATDRGSTEVDGGSDPG